MTLSVGIIPTSVGTTPTSVGIVSTCVRIITTLVGIIPALQKAVLHFVPYFSYKLQQCGNISYKIQFFKNFQQSSKHVGTVLPTQV